MTEATTGGEAQGPMAASPMSRAQIVVLAVAVLLAALDGFDVLGMAFVAPALSHAWALDKASLGLLLSTSLIGMAAGSLVLSPLADITGRKPMVFSAICLMILGSLLSALSHTVPQLAASRILTGVGIGVMVPLTTAIASEFASAKSRAFAVTATTVGFTAGSVVGSLIAAGLLKHHAWQSVFVSGAVAGLILLPITAFGLSESPAFLMSRRPKNALERLNKVLRRMGRPVAASLPEAPSQKRVSYLALLAPDMIVQTLCFAAAGSLVTTTTYYLLNWLPQLIADAGFPPSTGSLLSATTALVGMASGLLFGVAASRFGAARLASVAMVALGVAVAVFGFTPPVLKLLVASTALCGFFSGGTAGMFYATVAGSFPARTRVSALGLISGIGRVLSVSGPSVAGALFAAGLNRGGVSLIFACMPIVASVLVFVGARRAAAQLKLTTG